MKIPTKPAFPSVTRLIVELFESGALVNVSGVEVETDCGYVTRVKYSSGAIRLTYGSDIGINPAAACKVVKDKAYTKDLLRWSGFECPPGETFRPAVVGGDDKVGQRKADLRRESARANPPTAVERRSSTAGGVCEIGIDVHIYRLVGRATAQSAGNRPLRRGIARGTNRGPKGDIACGRAAAESASKERM